VVPPKGGLAKERLGTRRILPHYLTYGA